MYKQTRWTEKEDKFLKDNYSKLSPDKIAKKLNRSRLAITTRANRKGLNRDEGRWTLEEIETLKEMYDKHTMQEITSTLSRSVTSVYTKASELELVKGSKWTDKEKAYIKENYNKMTNYELGKKLKKTASQVGNMANRMGLEKHYTENLKVNWTEEEKERMLKDFHEGVSMISLTKKYKTNIGDIREIITETQRLRDINKTYSKEGLIDKYNLQLHQSYIINKLVLDKSTILRKKKVWIIGFYDNHFLIETEKGIKESIKYTDLIDKDYILKEAN